MKTANTLIAAISLTSTIDATKVVLHEIEEKSQFVTRSFNPLNNVRDVGSNRISFRGNSSSVQDDIFASEEETTEATNENVVDNSLSIGISTTEASVESTSARKDQISPFLSTTLLTTVSPISTSSLSTFDDAKQSAFSDAFIAFLEHVLKAQEVYDVKVLSVSIFDEELLSLDGSEVEERGGRRKLLTNSLQFSFTDDGYDDKSEYADDGAAAGDDNVQLERSQDNSAGTQDSNSQWVYKSLRFGIVLSAEHLLEPTQDTFMSKDQFQKIILHISNKFHSHLLEYVQDADLYFREVDRVDVTSYVGDGGVMVESQMDASTLGILKRMENEIKSVEDGTLNTWSIVAISLGGIALIGLMFATVKFYR
jgi:hypothetical protein